ncbi:hypothetical protein PV08_10489 [Exophiala spinifera]|uniref:Glycosyltransferase 2-like domain-containing protein n=1 Tax=Exophiala spinifera TaxID=91928 RepID=A0A0D2BIJ5_9EURO|nr:uncharacterized protein PV08_10489 [Exophiala spinifera]KIW11189.1 hypothetical protein PV08_10489 [Exophiala spinifera]
MSRELGDRLTIILTTSPTPSIPSTELIRGVLRSLAPSLSTVPLIITFDGFTICQNDKYLDGRLKKGQIPQQMAEAYPSYIANVKRLFSQTDVPVVQEAAMDHPKWRPPIVSRAIEGERSVTFIQHRRRQGFALSVVSALKHCTTPFVLVLQHDWVFEVEPPIQQLLTALRDEPDVNYITFVARKSTRYELTMGNSNVRLRAVFDAAKAMRRGSPLQSDLVPCLHFYDRPHLISVAKYYEILDAYPKLRKGDFFEDAIGTRFSHSISGACSNEDAIQAWKRIGTWMYAPDGGLSRAVRHTSGRTTLAEEQEKARKQAYITENLLAKLEGREPRHAAPLVDARNSERVSG